jgi:putative transcriptional regulator
MNRIRLIRRCLGLTQAQLAGPLGMSQGNVGHYEQGQTVPPDVAAKLIEYAKTLGVTLTFDHIYGTAELPASCAPAPEDDDADTVAKFATNAA